MRLDDFLFNLQTYYILPRRQCIQCLLILGEPFRVREQFEKSVFGYEQNTNLDVQVRAEVQSNSLFGKDHQPDTAL